MLLSFTGIIAQDVLKKPMQTRPWLQESNQKIVTVKMTTTMKMMKMKMVVLLMSLPSPQETAGEAMQAMRQSPLQYVPPPPCNFQPFKLLGTVVPQVQADNRFISGHTWRGGGSSIFFGWNEKVSKLHRWFQQKLQKARPARGLRDTTHPNPT